MMEIKKYLEGGDMRSIGQVERVVPLIKNQADFDALFEFVLSRDELLSMRAIDAVEKITVSHPEYLRPHGKAIFKAMPLASKNVIKWHLALIVARIDWQEERLGFVWEQLTRWATSAKESRIVRVNAIQALFELSRKHPELREDLRLTVELLEQSEIPSIKARLRILKKKGL